MAESDSVTVRAFGDEPVRLVAVATWPGWVEVANAEDRSKAIGFPTECVYRFDSELFDQLRETYERRQTKRLVELWERGMRFVE